MRKMHTFAALALMALIALPVFAETDDQRLEACRAKLTKAHELQVLYDLDWQKGKLPKVVVGPTFYQIAFDAKDGFAQTVNCFLMAGATDKYINFDLLDWRTNKVVARYSYGTLKVE